VTERVLQDKDAASEQADATEEARGEREAATGEREVSRGEKEDPTDPEEVARERSEALAELPTLEARPPDLRSFATLRAASVADDPQVARSFTAELQSCSVGTGIAFDGTNLLTSCWYSNRIDVVSTDDGHLIANYDVSGVNGIGALAYDQLDGVLWACDIATQKAVTIDPQTHVATPQFTTQGCHDGLSFDPTDNTVWSSADAAPTVQHYGADGTLLSSFDLHGTLDGCGNSGLAAGATAMFLANNGCSSVFEVPKDKLGEAGQTTKIGGYPARLEDLECDDHTFPDRTVIWTKDAYDSVINAFDVGRVDCGVSGYRDQDSDGLSDELESTPSMQAMGADPRHKDYFAEIDYYASRPHKVGPWEIGGSSRKPDAAMLDKVVRSFASMPISNPDGSNGITMHLDGGSGTVMDPKTGGKWGDASRSNAIYDAKPAEDWPEKTFWSELDKLVADNVDDARRGPFHYILLADHLDSCSLCLDGKTTGISRGIPGHDLIVAAGDVSGSEESVTLAHEIGHNLGLGHGGGANPAHPYTQGINEKANYLSIMNYFYSTTGMLVNVGGKEVGGSIVFSPQQLGTLDESNLDESAGLNPDPFGHWVVKYRCPNGKTKPGDGYAAIDWNCDGKIEDGSTNTKLQERFKDDDVWNAVLAKDPSLADHVYGSNDYPSVRFWGVGEAWDAKNKAIVDQDQPGTEEATIEQLAADDALYAYPTLLTAESRQTSIEVGSGVVSVPVSLSNPLPQDVTVTPSITDGSDIASLPSSGDVTVPASASHDVGVAIDTSKLVAGEARTVRVELRHPDAGVVTAQSITIAPFAPPAVADRCRDAAAVVADPAATVAQIAAEAVVDTCNAKPSGPSSPSSGSGGTASPPTSGAGGPARFDRAAATRSLEALLRAFARTGKKSSLRRWGTRGAFAVPAAGKLVVQLRTVPRSRARSVLVGQLRVSFATAQRKVLRLTVSRSARSLLRQHGKLRLRFSAVFMPSAGGSRVSASRTVALR
jgi:hypothetical protein